MPESPFKILTPEFIKNQEEKAIEATPLVWKSKVDEFFICLVVTQLDPQTRSDSLGCGQITAQDAKTLHVVLGEWLKRYESKHGPIEPLARPLS